MTAAVETNSPLKSRAKRGFTLTELAIVLGVMGAILGAIWTAAATVSANQKTAKAVRQILVLVEGIKSTYSTGTIPGGGQYLTPFAINSGLLPNDMIQSCTGTVWGANSGAFSGTAGCAVGPYQNQFLIVSQFGWWFPANAADFELFTESASMTSAQCIAFLGALVPQAVNDGLINVAINGAVTAVNNTTSPTAAWIQACPAGAEIALQFQL
jgi:prepilin-type N-terminal cleavage/methylation domain-containing protein